MENTMKMYVTADEAAQILGVSRGYAYKIIRGLNNELKEKGYRVISEVRSKCTPSISRSVVTSTCFSEG